MQGRFTDIVDADCAYQFFLGRTAESREARLCKTGQPLERLIGGFVGSDEFIQSVAGPVLAGKPVGQKRFSNNPSRYLKHWLSYRLLRSEQIAKEVCFQDGWAELYQTVLRDPWLYNLFERDLGGRAGLFRRALMLRRNGLSLASAPPPSNAVKRGPRFSVITPPPPSSSDLMRLIESMLDQTYPHWELVFSVTQNQSLAAAGLSGFERLDDRIKIAVIRPAATSQEEALLVACDLAGGEYLLVAPGLAFLPPESIAYAARLAIVHDRPGVLVAAPIKCDAEPLTFMRADIAVRAGLFDKYPACPDWLKLFQQAGAPDKISVQNQLSTWNPQL